MQESETAASDLDLLTAAQEEALRILSDARSEAASLTSGARDEATRVLLEQHEEAERLLATEAKDARVTASRVMRAVQDAPQQQKAPTQHAADRKADELLEQQRAAADALLACQASEARGVREGVRRAAAEILMKAHREAAGVLLHARMVVEERRSARAKQR